MSGGVEVRERPILFSGEMIRAILDGRKTQTRRVVAKMVTDEGARLQCYPGAGFTAEMVHREYPCPYGYPDDRLWVRETFRVYEVQRPVMGVGYELEEWPDRLPKDPSERELVLQLAADGHDGDEFCRWRPSVHMPRWASRLTLEVTDVRVERLQEISEEDARAEGCSWSDGAPEVDTGQFTEQPYEAREEFQHLWNDINAARGYGWDANPWVWVIGFRRVEGGAS